MIDDWMSNFILILSHERLHLDEDFRRLFCDWSVMQFRVYINRKNSLKFVNYFLFFGHVHYVQRSSFDLINMFYSFHYDVITWLFYRPWKINDLYKVKCFFGTVLACNLEACTANGSMTIKVN